MDYVNIRNPEPRWCSCSQTKIHWRSVTEIVISAPHGARILSLLRSRRKLSIRSTRGGLVLDFRFLLNLSIFSPNTSPVLKAEMRSSNSAVWSLLLQTDIQVWLCFNNFFMYFTLDVHCAADGRWSDLTADWRCFSYAPGFSFSS